MNDDVFLSEVSLQLKIESLVVEKRMTYLEAIIDFCDENSLEFDEIRSIMSINLKEKIKQDAMNDGLMKRESMLPI